MLMFFGKATMLSDIKHGYVKVILGQTIGFTVVVLLSLIGAIAGLIIPAQYTNLIGFLPVIIGLYKIFEALKESGYFSCCCPHTPAELKNEKIYEIVDQTDQIITFDTENSNFENKQDLVHLKMSKKIEDISDNDADISESNCTSQCYERTCAPCMDPFMLEVTTFALACSSDNIAIYMSLFAAVAWWELLFIVALFYVLLAFNILVALGLMKCERVASLIAAVANYVIPPVFIAVGLYILKDSVVGRRLLRHH